MGTRKHYYRIATSLAGLSSGWFIVRGLPEPEETFFQPFSVRVPQGLGGEGRHGYDNAFIQWEVLIREQAAYIESLITSLEATAGVGNGVIYLTMLRTDATSTGQSWVDLSGKVKMPEWRQERDSQGYVYKPVNLSLNNITIENEPSTAL